MYLSLCGLCYISVFPTTDAPVSLNTLSYDFLVFSSSEQATPSGHTQSLRKLAAWY
jgi:hypothetical protein